MHYYVYISDSKINMLYDQISDFDGKNKESFLGFNFAFLKGQIKESFGFSKSKQQKIEAIVKKLKKEGLVGSLQVPKQYIEGEFDMYWVYFLGKNLPIVYWSYKYDDRVLGLAGSSYHLLGQDKKPQNDDPLTSYSLFVNMTVWMVDHIDLINEPHGENFFVKNFDEIAKANNYYDGYKNTDFGSHNISWMIYNMYPNSHTKTNANFIMNKFKFIAKVIYTGEYIDRYPNGLPNDKPFACKTLLATPIFVELID